MTPAEIAFIQSEYSDEFGTRISPCIEIIVFTDARLSNGPHQGLLNFYTTFRKHFGSSIKWFRTNTDDHFKKAKAATLDMVLFWMSDPRSMEETRLGLELKPGAQAKDMQVPAFEFFCTDLFDLPAGVFRMALPLQKGYETLEKILPIIHECMADFPLVSGYAGYSVYWDTLDFRFEKAFFNQNMPRLYMRHPGINLADPASISNSAQEGLMGVSWLTLLGPKPLAQLGGIGVLQEQLNSPIEVMPLACKGGGAIIVAGQRPLVGDLNEGDDLPLYKTVGHALRKARYPNPFYGAGLSKDLAPDWFLRFFGKDA